MKRLLTIVIPIVSFALLFSMPLLADSSISAGPSSVNRIQLSALITEGAGVQEFETPVARFNWDADTILDYNVLFDASSSTCPSKTCTYTWDFGDGHAGTGKKTNHIYTGAGTLSVTLTAKEGNGSSTYSLQVTPEYRGSNPTTAMVTATSSAIVTTVTWSISGGIAPYTVQINWGDGTTTLQSDIASGQATTTHAYRADAIYFGSVYIVDSGMTGKRTTSKATFRAAATLIAVSGTVTRHNGKTPIANAYVYLVEGDRVRNIAVTDTNGTFTFKRVVAGTYTVKAQATGYKFPDTPTVVVTASDVTGVNVNAK